MTLHQAIAAAKAKTNDPKWLRAIDRAAAGLQSGELCVTLFSDGYALITTATGQHRVNGRCDCTAAQHGHTACVHRCAKRLVEMMETAPETLPTEGKVSRPALIADIKRAWPATWPPLAVELMARFRKNQLEFLDDDMLRRVRLAIAM